MVYKLRTILFKLCVVVYIRTMNTTRTLILVTALLLLQVCCYYGLRAAPSFVENFYSTGVYPYIAGGMRYGLGWIPFSFGDVMYVVCIILLLRWLWLNGLKLLKLSREIWIKFIVGVNIVLALFHVLWGFNYYRNPLHVTLEMEPTYSVASLKNSVDYYLQSSNKLHRSLQADSLKPVAFTRSQQELFAIAATGFNRVKQPELKQAVGPVSIKKSLLTLPLSYMGYSGYLNPITGEAQTNGYINFYKAPVLILHEMAHQLGYAKENEANYIAINAGMAHDDTYFKYSASIFALYYLLNDLAQKDREAFEQYKLQMRPGILVNYTEYRDFWQHYEGTVVEEVSHATYNQYLKVNNQPDGMQTYSYVVALLVNDKIINTN